MYCGAYKSAELWHDVLIVADDHAGVVQQHSSRHAQIAAAFLVTPLQALILGSNKVQLMGMHNFLLPCHCFSCLPIDVHICMGSLQ